MRTFTGRVFAALAVASAVRMLVPTEAMAQQSQTPMAPASPTAPVTTAPATEATAGAGGELQKVTVTGYLVPRIGDGTQPVTTLDQDFITKQADQSVADVIARLPEAVAALNPIAAAGNTLSPGETGVRLKGLPLNATLVLVDGIRFPSAPFAENTTTGGPLSFVDLNSFPLSAVDRIEILKDGGSATYGSDAVAGVINLVLKTSYKGTDLNYYYGIDQRGDYEVNHGQFTSGISHSFSETSKLDLVASFDVFTSTPIEADDRAYAHFLQHSRYSPKYPDRANFWNPLGTFSDPASGTQFAVKPGTAGPNITAADFDINGPSPQNFDTKFQQVIPRETRYGGSVYMGYDATSWLKLYDSLILQRNEELSVTPNQGYFSGDGITVPANNPFNPFGIQLQQSGFPTNALYEMGPWRTDTIIKTLRNTAGLTLQLPHDWFVNASFTFGESDGSETIENSTNAFKLQQAMNGTLPGFVGQFFNPFTDQRIDSPNRQFHDALRADQILDTRTDLVDWIVKAGGTIWDLPGGALTAAGGLEYRSESLIQVNDQNSLHNNITVGDFLGPQISGRRYVQSAYGEVTLPILGGKWSWPGARLLEVIFSERYDNFSDFGSAAKPKVAVRFKPFDDLTLRATYSEGFVAPTLSQLFGTPIQGIVSINDPVLGTSYQTNSTTGGNQNLKPENSYGYYAGAVWSPGAADPEHSWWGWANGFTAYIDWYQTTIRNLIGTVTAQQIVDSPASFPGAVTRGPNGAVVNIEAPFQNLGTRTVDGFDFGFSYVTKEQSWGKIDVEANAAFIYNYKINQFLGPGANGKPKFNIWDQEDSFGVPDFKSVVSLFYSKQLFGIDTFRTGFTFNYVDSEHDVNDNFKGTNPTATLDAPNYVHLIGSFCTVDWQISYALGEPTPPLAAAPLPGYSKDGKQIIGEKAISPKPEGSSSGIRKWLANTTLTFGINNIGDVKPPYSADTNTQGFDTGNANPFGRQFYVQIDKKF
jgi:iron complex outermembrane recepter protein